jgi:hypothetical protein
MPTPAHASSDTARASTEPATEPASTKASTHSPPAAAKTPGAVAAPAPVGTSGFGERE